MSRRVKDICLIGAGLGNGLLAWFLRKRHPHLNVVIFESKDFMAGNRTWSFHEADISPQNFEILKELIAHQWSGYQVRFPRLERYLQSGYATLTPERLQQELIKVGVDFHFSNPVRDVQTDHIVTVDGRKLFYDCIIDGRGFEPSTNRMGYQKFVGQVIRLEQSHGLSVPLLMDATVPQKDGYRFFYVLPLSETDLLVEDTRYSVFGDLNVDDYTLEIQKYATQKKWKVEKILRRESGVLPIPLKLEQRSPSVLKLGMQGDFFHPVTGYSLPDSVRLADRITSLPTVESEAVKQVLRDYRRERALRKSFYLTLNRMMFLGAKDEDRRKIFEHFYSLPTSTIERFYAGETNFVDGIRILTGKPPVPLIPALRAAFSQAEKETR